MKKSRVAIMARLNSDGPSIISCAGRRVPVINLYGRFGWTHAPIAALDQLSDRRGSTVGSSHEIPKSRTLTTG